MKKLTICFVLIIISFLNRQETKIKDPYINALYNINALYGMKGINIPNSEIMKALAERYAGDLKAGFDQVGMSDVNLAFLDALKTGHFIEKYLPVGERFTWMLFRIQGKVKALEDVEWAGKEPIEVLSIAVQRGNKSYEFILTGKTAGNIALLRVNETKTEPPPQLVKDIFLDSEPEGAKVYLIPLSTWEKDPSIFKDDNRLAKFQVPEGCTPVYTTTYEMVYQAVFDYKGRKEMILIDVIHDKNNKAKVVFK